MPSNSLVMEEVSVSHMEELLQNIGGRKDKCGRIFLLFCGDPDKTTGENWCPDCVKGKIINQAPPIFCRYRCGRVRGHA